MPRNWLLAHWKRIAMQASLCGLLLATAGLAAFVVHAKRLALRLPLANVVQSSRLGVCFPKAWPPAVFSELPDGGNVAQTDEPVPEPLTGRKLSVRRLPAAGLPSPLEFLLRAGLLTPRDLTGREPASHDKLGPVARVTPLEVAHWPGVMVSRSAMHASGRRSLKEVVACAVLPHGQAVVIKLDGVGPPDAADEELVRQIAETTLVYGPPAGSKPEPVLPEPAGTLVEMGDGVFAAVPEHFTPLPPDDRLSRDLLGDGVDGHWVAIELIPCVWLADEPAEQFLTMLAAHDPTWHSAKVNPLGETAWSADRVPLAGEMNFPARAYCITNGVDQAMVAVVHGGWRDGSGFDTAWAGVSRSVRFTRPRDVAGMLARGATEVTDLATQGLTRIVPPKLAWQNWVTWNASENSDRQDWMTLKITPPATDAAGWSATRTPSATAAAGTAVLQSWDGAADFSTYSVQTDLAVSAHGETSVRRTTQRLDLRDGKLSNPLSSDEPRPVPPQYVPGGWLPLALGRVSDKPMILRTESFIACDGAAPPGLLTLLVTRSRADGANCVTAVVNGSGRVTKFWYDPAGVLRQIDFGTGLRAQGIDATGSTIGQ